MGRARSRGIFSLQLQWVVDITSLGPILLYGDIYNDYGDSCPKRPLVSAMKVGFIQGYILDRMIKAMSGLRV